MSRILIGSLVAGAVSYVQLLRGLALSFLTIMMTVNKPGLLVNLNCQLKVAAVSNGYYPNECRQIIS